MAENLGFLARLEVKGFAMGQPVSMRIFKEEAELEVWMQNGDQFALFKTYPSCNYPGDLGPKLREGDRQSPEGFYFVGKSALNPNSSYRLSLIWDIPMRKIVPWIARGAICWCMAIVCPLDVTP